MLELVLNIITTTAEGLLGIVIVLGIMAVFFALVFVGVIMMDAVSDALDEFDAWRNKEE